MHTPDAQGVNLPEPIVPERSPLIPRHLADLFLRPRAFFMKQLALGHTPYVLVVSWCYGASHAIDRLDQNLLRGELGRPRPGWDYLAPFVVESWLGFWLYVALVGALSAAGLWYVGGWWYRVRLRWAGSEDPDPRLARLVYVYSAFVLAAPTVLAAVISTAFFANYGAAFASDEAYSLLLLVFPFWSIVTSYVGASTVFRLSGWRVALWFLVLPTLVYVVALGVVALLFALLPDGAA